jgi:ankyrin repeat protein
LCRSFEILWLLTLDDVPWTLADADGSTCLHHTLRFGRCKVLFSLWINSPIDLTIRNNRGRSVLHIAAATGQADLVEFLVVKSCEVNDRDVAGQTALHLAAAGLDLRPISKFIECRANMTVRNNNGCILVDKTSRYGNAYAGRFPIECTLTNSLQQNPVGRRTWGE